MDKYKELMWDELINKCKCLELGFETTEELPSLEGIIGQKRAASAMEFGLSIKRYGYNIFVSGLTGTGRSSYTRSIAKKIAANEKTSDDWCYVYNFNTPDKPVAINLPAGMGYTLAEDMDRLIKLLRVKIPKTFQGEEYEKQKNQVIEEFQKDSSQIMDDFNEFAKEQGFMIKRSEQGLLTIPVVDGKPIEEERYINMDPEDRKKVEEKSYVIKAILESNSSILPYGIYETS